MKIGKFEFPPKLDRLEVYLLAADNPVGKKQYRPIFRRKRNKIVLTREQVYAIKRGRRVLRAEMKARGLKRRIDFEETATNLGLYFDRKGLLWPFFLWLIRDNTVAKILATTAVLTTIVTVTEPVIQYVTQIVTQIVTQTITQTITETIDKDRFTISLSEEMYNKGFELSEDPEFTNPSDRLICEPAWDVSPISISDIPANIDLIDAEHHGGSSSPENQEEEETPDSEDPEEVEMGKNLGDRYFAYTFYCRYINKDAEAAAAEDANVELTDYLADYDWGLHIIREGLNPETADPEEEGPAEGEETTEETVKLSDAVWVMVIQDGEVMLRAKARKDGSLETLPSAAILAGNNPRAFADHTEMGINACLSWVGATVDTIGRQIREGDEGYRKQVDAQFATYGITDLTQLMLRSEEKEGWNWRNRYAALPDTSSDWDFYQVIPDKFESDTLVVQKQRKDMKPYIKDISEDDVHKYTVVFWLEGDDPDCSPENTEYLMGSYIGMNFQIKGVGEQFETEDTTDTEDSDREDNSR